MSVGIGDVLSFLAFDEKALVDVIVCSRPVATLCALAHRAFPDQGIFLIRLTFRVHKRKL
jgi:hypothetical protein